MHVRCECVCVLVLDKHIHTLHTNASRHYDEVLVANVGVCLSTVAAGVIVVAAVATIGIVIVNVYQ